MVSIINAHIQRTKDTKAELISAMQELALALRAAGSGTLDTAKYAGQALHMLTRGQVKVNMEVLGSEAPMRSLSIIINRLSLGIIVAGLFIGSSMVALSTMEPARSRGSRAVLLRVSGRVGAVHLGGHGYLAQATLALITTSSSFPSCISGIPRASFLSRGARKAPVRSVCSGKYFVVLRLDHFFFASS